MPDPLGSQNVVLRNENEVKAHLSEYLRAAESGDLHIAKSTRYAYLRHRGVPVGVSRAGR